MYAPDRRAGKTKPKVVSPIVFAVFGLLVVLGVLDSILHQSSFSWGIPLPARQIHFQNHQLPRVFPHFEENAIVKLSLKQITITK